MDPSKPAPAIIQAAVDVLVRRATALAAAIRNDERMTLDKAIKLGELLETIKGTCEHGEYGPALESIGISTQRASEYRRIAKVPHAGLSTCESITDARRLVGPDEDEQVKPPPQVANTPAIPTPEVLVVDPQKILCRPCRVSGKPKAKCKECAALNKPPEPAKPPPISSPAVEALAAEMNAEEQKEKTKEEEIAEVNLELDRLCRSLKKTFDDGLPKDPWLDDLNRKDSAAAKLKQCCETIRTAKCSFVCPKCEGQGCVHCRETGRVPKMNYDQMV